MPSGFGACDGVQTGFRVPGIGGRRLPEECEKGEKGEKDRWRLRA
jgi:hypothetical protein